MEQTLEPQDRFNADLRRQLLKQLGADGAWLLLSIISYGWRAQYDLAVASFYGPRPKEIEGEPPGDVQHHFDIVQDLHVQSLLFSVAEQFATLLRAARRHANGQDGFFESYVQAPQQLADVLNDVQAITREEVVKLVGEPSDLVIQSTSTADSDIPSATSAILVAGIHVPESAIRRAAHDQVRKMADEVVNRIVDNAQELQQFVRRPPVLPNIQATARSLRDVDNAFRHGLRVLFHECVPERRTFRVASIVQEATDHSVDLFMPDRRGRGDVEFATVSCTFDRTIAHLEAMEQLCIRIGQLSRGYAGYLAFGDARWLAASADLSLPGSAAGSSSHIQE